MLEHQDLLELFEHLEVLLTTNNTSNVRKKTMINTKKYRGMYEDLLIPAEHVPALKWAAQCLRWLPWWRSTGSIASLSLNTLRAT
jgi:hypothetical protein